MAGQTPRDLSVPRLLQCDPLLGRIKWSRLRNRCLSWRRQEGGMVEGWRTLVFGWPAVVLAFAAFAAGFPASRPWLGFVGAAVATPFCFYVSGYPLFHWGALI